MTSKILHNCNSSPFFIFFTFVFIFWQLFLSQRCLYFDRFVGSVDF